MPPKLTYQHEALDRCFLISSILQEHLIDHPFVQSTKAIKAKLMKAQDLISEAYQQIGNREIPDNRVKATLEQLARKSDLLD